MSKSSKSENYKDWTRVWGNEVWVDVGAAQRYADGLGKKPEASEVIEEYPGWAKDYHAVVTDTGKFVMNPEVSYQTVPPVPEMSIGFKPDNDLAEKLWSEGGSWDSLSELAAEAPSGQDILEAGIDILSLLLKKNISYGNSAIEPLRLFSNASVEEQIMVRIDDKLSRLKNNQSYPGDNDVDDLIGYLILLKVVRRKSRR